MKKFILSVLVVFMATVMVFGQAKTEREIKNLFAQIEKTQDDGKRTQLANQIQHKMIDAIFEAEDFFYDFPSLKNVGKILSSDNQIHMYTWNILLTDGTPLYFAVIQHYDFGGIYVLSQSEPIVPATTGYVAEANWYGALYYDIHPIKFKDKDGVQIMKDYMASGSFARGKEEKAASASMVFVGNINQSVDVLLKTSSLFDPFPMEMGTDTAFLDRIHCYIPGWEVPKFRPEHFTNDYGFITDYLSEFIRELRKEQCGDALDKYFKLGKNLNQRDTIAVRKIVGGFVKLLYPDGIYTKEELEEILRFALEMRRRVKEQLKKLGGMEFYDVNFSYIDNETFDEKYVSVPEQGGGKLIPDGICNPGQIYTVSRGKNGMLGVFRLESQMIMGNGKFDKIGLSSESKCKESANTAFNYIKANGNRISGAISTTARDYIVNYQDLQGLGMTEHLALPTLIALSSIALSKPTLSSLAILGDISIAGTLMKVEELANSLQVCMDSGAKKVLLPILSAADLGSVPSDLIGSFNLIFYSSAEDAVFKALGVE